MTQHLFWNFEYSTPPSELLNLPQELKKDSLKWEARYFWESDEVICLQAIDPGLLDLTLYKKKQKLDDYYLIPNSTYNIKLREDRLLYKPLLHRSLIANGYGRKICLQETKDYPKDINSEFLSNILHQAQTTATILTVAKESYTFKFSTTPSVKLELARLEVHNEIYFSACIEGRSQVLVELISDALLGKQKSCDYVTFLNTLITP